MSWGAYIDQLMALEEGKPILTDAAIWGTESGKIGLWASTPNFTITEEEVKKLTSNRSDFGQNGPKIGGLKCRLIRDNMDTDGMFCLDLKTSQDTEGNTYNVCVGKTQKALIIGKGSKDATGGQVSKRVFTLVEHLRKAGF